ncbi:MAG: ABC transporter permease [Candidatus Omnitrophica bacterium]|nr:ABC transporter permease [Candidatus Omnitrophota bacterium]
MTYEWLIARRYIWSKRRHPFVGVISTISILGITVGVAALITVLAVMNGFDEELKSRIIGTRAHLVLEKDGVFDETEEVAERLAAIGGIAQMAPFIEGQALIQNQQWSSGVLVRGIDPPKEKNVSKFYDYLVDGTLSDVPGGVVIGSELKKRMGIKMGSQVGLVTQMKKKPAPFVVEGVFSSGMYEFDANLIFLNWESASALFDFKNSTRGLSIALKNPEDAKSVKGQIQDLLGFPYIVRTWMETNKTLFGALQLEKMVMFLILALIIFVACLNIAGSLTILVMDKTKDIGVLKALGAKPFSLMAIFAIDGFLIGGIGALTGCGVGIGLCALLKKYSFIDLPREIYYMDKLPVSMDPADTAWVIAVALALSFLSALYPAVMAARLDPVKALRYE